MSKLTQNKVTLIRLAFSFLFVKALPALLKDKLEDKIEELEDLHDKQFKLSAESETAMNAYRAMKLKLTSKDQEIDALKEEVAAFKKQVAKL